MIKHFLLLLLVLAQTLYAAAGLEAAEIPPKPQAGTNIYVQDYADVISPDSEKIIYSIGRELDSKTTAQVAVLTVPTLDGEPIESYALKVLRGWGIGSRDKNNGVLIVVATQDRQSRIEVGYGLEGALPDGLTGRLQDDTMLPYFKQGQYDKGIVNGYAATAATVAKEYNVKLEGVSYTPPAPKQNDSLPLWAELAIGIGIVLLLVIDNVFLGGFITQMLILSIFRRGGGGAVSVLRRAGRGSDRRDARHGAGRRGIAVAGRSEGMEHLRTHDFRLARLPYGQHPAPRRRILHLHIRRLAPRPENTQGRNQQQRHAEIPYLRGVHLPRALRLPGSAAADLPG